MDRSPRLAPWSETDPLNILVVDDQPAKLLSYEVALAETGETLIKASSACEAFECLLKNDIALILIDVCMPDLDGFELAALIREHPRFKRIAIIFVSAIMHLDLHRLRGHELGALDYVPVPVLPELLRAKVKVFLDLHRKTRQLKRCGTELEQRVLERTAELSRCKQELERRVEERTRERESALAQLFVAQQRETMGQLAEVAHDFNNLLMTVLGSLTLLDKHLPEDPTGRGFLRDAAQGAQRGATLTRSLLAFSRRRDSMPTSIDISSVVSGVEQLLKHALGVGIELTCQFPRALPPVLADGHQLELALLTVALDARHDMPEGGKLTLTASGETHARDGTDPPLPAGHYVRIKVISSVADGTVRATPAGALCSTGVNVGALSVIRMMIGRFGGALHIEPRPNGGTAVELWLPQAMTTRADHNIGAVKVGPPATADRDGRVGL